MRSYSFVSPPSFQVLWSVRKLPCPCVAMAMRELVEAECGGANPLMKLTSHMSKEGGAWRHHSTPTVNKYYISKWFSLLQVFECQSHNPKAAWQHTRCLTLSFPFLDSSHSNRNRNRRRGQYAQRLCVILCCESAMLDIVPVHLFQLVNEFLHAPPRPAHTFDMGQLLEEMQQIDQQSYRQAPQRGAFQCCSISRQPMSVVFSYRSGLSALDPFLHRSSRCGGTGALGGLGCRVPLGSRVQLRARTGLPQWCSRRRLDEGIYRWGCR